MKPCDARLDVGHDDARRLVRPRDHHDRQAEIARRFDLGVRRRAAGILGNDHVNLLVAKQAGLGGAVERSARLQEADVGRQGGLLRRIDGARDVVMLRRRRKGVQLESSQAQEDAAWRGAERHCGRMGVAHALPEISGSGLPGRTCERNQRNTGRAAGGNGVGGDLVCVGMGGVNDHIDTGFIDESSEPIGAAEADFVIALYNPASKARPHQLGEAFTLLRTTKAGETPVLFVRAAGTAEAKVITTTLAVADATQADMRTLVIVGSSTTRQVGRWVYTPRSEGGAS